MPEVCPENEVFHEVTIGPCHKTAKQVIIYALLDPVTGEPRYVGKTTEPSARRRYRCHKYDAKRKKTGNRWVVRWLNKLYREGAEPKIVEIAIVPPWGNWEAAERRWVRRLRDRGYRLTNLTNGGEGIDGLVVPQERRDKIAAKIRRGAWKSCLQCGKEFWRKPHEIKSGDDKFCSRKCYGLWQRGKSRPMPCNVIGREVSRRLRLSITECKMGHPYSPENTYINPRGARICRTCRAADKRMRRRNNKDLFNDLTPPEPVQAGLFEGVGNG